MEINQLDAVRLDRQRGARPGDRGWAALVCFVAVFALSFMLYLREMGMSSDLSIHAGIASEFSFADPHSITCRIAYPVWHVIVRSLMYLGLPLSYSAALVTAVFKLGGMLVTYSLYRAMLSDTPAWVSALAATVTMIVTGVRISSVNPFVYVGVSSPNVWHNPTQITVSFTMLLCVPYTVHCWYEFRRILPQMGDHAMLPWKKVIVLAVLLAASTLCKPTFMQTLLPAAFVFFLVQWIRNPRNSRYFGQIILAYIPAAVCFLVQYLYYTGVLVPFTSGVSMALTLDSVLFMTRAVVMMTAFPLMSLMCMKPKDIGRDKMLVLTLLITLFALVESIVFRETGMRERDGNFTWGCASASLLMWVVMTPKYIGAIKSWRANGLALWQKIGCALSSGLLAWHIASGVYYIVYLLTSGQAY